jgi:hypothetical protein
MDVFQLQTPVWNRTNLMFEHHFGGCCSNATDIEYADTKPHNKPGRFRVAADETHDYTDWAYGEMPHNLTARPIYQFRICSECGPKGYYEISRDMFGNKNGDVQIDFPCAYGCYLAGCQSAEVRFVNAAGGNEVKGSMYHNMCFGTCSSEIAVEFNRGRPEGKNPKMVWRWFGPLDEFKYMFCCDTWVGWRGTTGTDADGVVAYDQSYILNQCDAMCLLCAQLGRCNNNFCNAYDYAPRFTRSEDIRRLINGRYDWQLARRDFNLQEPNLVEYSLQEGSVFVKYPLAPAENMCALYTARLYHDVKCTIPFLRWGNGIGAKETHTAVDVSYRGSADQRNPSDDDHLVVLAGLIINAVWSFPSTTAAEDGNQCGTGWGRNLGPVDNVRRGRILAKADVAPPS